MAEIQKQSFPIRFFIFLFVLGGLLTVGWLWWQDAISSVDASNTAPQEFVIKQGEGVRGIAARLSQQNLIRSSTGFYILVKLKGTEKQIQAGDFRLNRSMDALAVAKELTHGSFDVWVTTLEGWRSEEIATKLTKELDIPQSEFLTYSHEGYMFPDTYLIERNATAQAIAKLYLDTFDQKVSALRSDAKLTGLPFDEAVTLASIVEREGRTDEDRPVIAGILLKRLKANWPLQADATLQYILGYQPAEKSWWKKVITDADKKIVSPYNTYLHTGLPPGPISNPGLASLTAVIHPKETDYWFYLHDTAGQAHFAKTIEEHNKNIETYLE